MKKNLIMLYLCWCSLILPVYCDVYKTNLALDSTIIITGLSATLGTAYLDKREKPTRQESTIAPDAGKINRFDRSATTNYSISARKWSDRLLTGLVLVPTLLYCNNDIQASGDDIGILYVETLTMNSMLTQVNKRFFKRTRPYAYGKEATSAEKEKTDTYRSFFSGHTSTAFMASTFTIKVCKDYHLLNRTTKIPLYSTLLASSVLTGYLRYKAGKHFPSDIITGAVVGSACGYFIPALHQTKEESQTKMIRMGFSF